MSTYFPDAPDLGVRSQEWRRGTEKYISELRAEMDRLQLALKEQRKGSSAGMKALAQRINAAEETLTLVGEAGTTPLSVTVAPFAYYGTGGAARGGAKLSWSLEAETLEGDDSEEAPGSAAHFEVWLRATRPAPLEPEAEDVAVPAAPEDDSRRVTATPSLYSELTDLDLGTEYAVKVRPIAASGAPGTFSVEAVFSTPAAPVNAAPSAPTPPALTATPGAIAAAWNGLLVDGAPAAGFREVVTEMQVGAAWVRVGQTLGRAGDSIITGPNVGESVTLRFLAVSILGNVSAPSATATMVMKGVELGDVEADIITAISDAQAAGDDAYAFAQSRGRTWTQGAAPASGVTHEWTGTEGDSPSVQKLNGVEQLRNKARNPRFDRSTTTVEVRRNKALNPRAVAGGGDPYTGSRYSWNHTIGVAIADHPLGITTAVRSARSTGGSVGGGRGIDRFGNSDVTPGTTTYWLGYPVTAGVPTPLSVWARWSLNIAAKLHVRYHDGAGNWVGVLQEVASIQPGAGVWGLLSVWLTPPAGAKYLSYRVSAADTSAALSTDYLDITGFMDDAAGPFFDGAGASSPDPDLTVAWTGPVNGSASVLRGNHVSSTAQQNALANASANVRSIDANGKAWLRVIPQSNGNDTGALVAGSGSALDANGVAFVPGQTYTVIAKSRLKNVQQGTFSTRARQIFYTDSVRGYAAPLTTAGMPNAVGELEQRLTFTVSPGATWAQIRLYNGASLGEIYWSDLAIVDGTYTGDYFDGGYPDERAQDLWIDTANGNLPMRWDATLNAWSSGRDAGVTTAQAIANGKNKLIRSTADASLPANYIAGDAWYKLSGAEVVSIWLHDGAAWVLQTLRGETLTNLVADRITTGTLAADRIGASTISVSKLLVTSMSNLAENGSFEYIDTVTGRARGWTYHPFATTPAAEPRTGTRSLAIGTNGNNFVAATSEAAFAVEAGESYRISGNVKVAAGTSVATGITLRFTYGPTEASTTTTSADIAATPAGTGTAYVPMTASNPTTGPVWVVPAGARFARIQVVMRDNAIAGTRTYHVDDLGVYMMASSDLIVDGSITALKIKAGEVKTDALEANAITGAKIAAGAIDGKTITGAVVQTVTTAARGIKLTGTSFKAYDAVGNETVSIDGATGAATFTGEFRSSAVNQAMKIWSESLSIGGAPGIVSEGHIDITPGASHIPLRDGGIDMRTRTHTEYGYNSSSVEISAPWVRGDGSAFTPTFDQGANLSLVNSNDVGSAPYSTAWLTASNEVNLGATGSGGSLKVTQGEVSIPVDTKLRLYRTDDVSATSTTHAFQIGLDSSANLAIDNNEIQARNNGSGSGLILNGEGGTITLGAAGAAQGIVSQPIRDYEVSTAAAPTGTGLRLAVIGSTGRLASLSGQLSVDYVPHLASSSTRISLGANPTSPTSTTSNTFLSVDSDTANTWAAFVNRNGANIFLISKTGGVRAVNVYDNDITTTRRAMWVSSAGDFGYASSTRAAKQDITPAKLAKSALRQIPIVHYRYIAEVEKQKADPDYRVAVEIGTLAEDMHELGLWPFVQYKGRGADAVPVGVHYEMLGLAAIQLGQILADELDEVRDRLDVLEEKMARLLGED